MKRIFFATVALATLAGCDRIAEATKPTVREAEAAKAARAVNSVDFSAGNAEQENVLRNAKLTSDPGLAGFLVQFSYGRPIGYYTVKGKVTSCSKRLERPEELIHGDSGEFGGDFVVDAPSYDGTYGHTDPNCYYFWTTSDRYVRSNMEYSYSDQPFQFDTKSAVELVK